MISLRSHNVLDYVIGVFLVLCPYLFGFSDVIPARDTFLILGYGLIGYSLLTKYYYALFRVIPLAAHMFLDVLAGIVLLLAPTVGGYRADITGAQYALHIILGLGALALVTFTRNRTADVTSQLPRHTGVRTPV